MSNSNMVVIGNRIKEIIESLLLEVAAEDDHESQEWVSRQWTIPSVSFRKRKSGRGREDGTMRINEGITIVPMGSISFPVTIARRIACSHIGKGQSSDTVSVNDP